MIVTTIISIAAVFVAWSVRGLIWFSYAPIAATALGRLVQWIAGGPAVWLMALTILCVGMNEEEDEE